MEATEVETVDLFGTVSTRKHRPAQPLNYDWSRASDTDLLATLVGDSAAAYDAISKAGSLAKAVALAPVLGISAKKAQTLAAAAEIGRRIASRPTDEAPQIHSPADVAALYGPLMRDLPREIFKVVLLNTSNRVIGDFNASEGGLSASIVEPRAVFRTAILQNAAAIICLHNHPSGNPEPSQEDVRVTRQLVDAGKLVGIPVHDHIIIAGSTFTSLAERGLMGS